MTFNFYGLGELVPISLFFSYVFSMELGLDLWRHYLKNATAVSTAVEDVETRWARGTARIYYRSLSFSCGLLRRLLGP